MMSGLNRRVREFLTGIRLAELTSDAPSPLVQITSFSSSVGAASAGSSQLKSKLEKSS